MRKSKYDLNVQECRLLLKCEARKGIVISPRCRHVGQLVRLDLAAISHGGFMHLLPTGIAEAQWIRGRWR